jgi:murein DD-endopeptidase MepM/ murein hydrolase activator NlpD
MLAGLLAMGVGAAPACDVPVMPVAGEMTSPFGAKRGRGWHSGVDIRAPNGTPIQAAAAGVVVFAGPFARYGLTVEVEHSDGTRARYAHLARIDRATLKGRTIAAGQVIGQVGRTGAATGNHLHLELRIAGRTVDPWPWLIGDGCVEREARAGPPDMLPPPEHDR